MKSKFDWKSKKFWTDGWGSFGLAILVALTIRWAFFEAYVIPSGSMLPSLLIHDHIFVNKFVYGVRAPFSESWLVKFSEPKRGDVIVFKYPVDMSTFFIKRVIGEPGDRVAYRDGDLYVNDKLFEKIPPPADNKDFEWIRDDDFRSEDNPYDGKSNYTHFVEKLENKDHSVLLAKNGGGLDQYGPVIVPEGQLFVMGDNRDRSADSRRWGFVPKEYILGKASVVWLSCEETLPVVKFLCNPLTLRWKRFFHVVN